MNHVTRAPSEMARSGCVILPDGDDHIGAGGERDLGRLDLGFHAAFRKLGTGVSRHRLDLGRDLGDERNMLGARSSLGGAV